MVLQVECSEGEEKYLL